MPTIEPEKRCEALQRLLSSERIVRLALGEPLDPIFWFRCAESSVLYPGGGGYPPEGPTFIPLWECCGTETGCWVRNGRLEFIDFSIECPEEYCVIAYSEQGLLANLFWDLIEDQDWDNESEALDRLRAGAAAVGFLHLDETLRAQSATGGRDRDAFSRSIV